MLLIGDILQDARMVDDSRHSHVVRVGFCNKATACVDAYLEHFDLVISRDGSLCPVLSILNRVVDAKNESVTNEAR